MTKIVPWRNISDASPLVADDDVVPFALETGGTPIHEFRFPAKGIAFVGNEELGISPFLMESARRNGGICSISLHGPKASLNVSVAVGILLQNWRSQRPL